jgi:dihydrolipoamide dehydrogenase
MGKGQGLVRVYGDRASGRLLGAEMLGPRVEHTAHLLAWAVQLGTSVERALELPFYHPVIEEGIRTALRQLARELKLTRAPCAHELDCGPGVAAL